MVDEPHGSDQGAIEKPHRKEVLFGLVLHGDEGLCLLQRKQPSMKAIHRLTAGVSVILTSSGASSISSWRISRRLIVNGFSMRPP